MGRQLRPRVELMIKLMMDEHDLTWALMTALILASRSLVMTPLEISSRRGCCWVLRCSWNSASHLTMSSTADQDKDFLSVPMAVSWTARGVRRL